MKKRSITKMFFAAAIIFTLTAAVFLRQSPGMILDPTGETSAQQPSLLVTSPGGLVYSHGDIAMFQFGEGTDQFWIFEPIEPQPESAPVIVFFHGWSAMYPKMYGGWIRHLVQRGNIVIYPRYQDSINVMPPVMVRAAFDAVKKALAELEKPGHVRPDTDRFSVVGHSFGGVLTSNLAATWKEEGLPKVRAAMPVEPGDPKYSDLKKMIKREIPSIMVDYSGIDPDTLFVCVVGADDKIVGERTALEIFTKLTSIPAENKNYILFETDRHGTPLLAADHMLPIAADESFDVTHEITKGPIRGIIRNRIERLRERKEQLDYTERNMYDPDAYDYNGLWRLFDALTDCAFESKNCDLALGGSEKVTTIGEWSDGVQIKNLKVIENPGKTKETTK